MKLFAVLILAFTAIACDKTIHEVRWHPADPIAPAAPAQVVAQAR